MFGAILTVGFTALLAYVVARAASVPVFARPRPRRTLLALGALLWLAFLLGRFLGHGRTGPLPRGLEGAGMTVMGAVLLLATALLLVDLVTLFGLLLPRLAPALRGAALVAGAILTAAALVQGHRAPAVTDHEVTLPGLPRALDGTVVVVLSDVHLGGALDEGWFAARMAEVAALRPDLVLFLGDTFEGHGDLPAELPALRTLSPRLGKWFVNGNHEAHGSAASDALLERSGVRRLSNAWAEAAPGLVLAGLDDVGRWQPRTDGAALQRALSGRPPGATVLLSHQPREPERAARAGVGLMLSGHTHGGQLWPFGLLVARVYPVAAGRGDVDGMPVIVSRGVGTWGPRMRLWRRSELVRVTLRAP